MDEFDVDYDADALEVEPSEATATPLVATPTWIKPIARKPSLAAPVATVPETTSAVATAPADPTTSAVAAPVPVPATTTAPALLSSSSSGSSSSSSSSATDDDDVSSSDDEVDEPPVPGEPASPRFECGVTLRVLKTYRSTKHKNVFVAPEGSSLKLKTLQNCRKAGNLGASTALDAAQPKMLNRGYIVSASGSQAVKLIIKVNNEVHLSINNLYVKPTDGVKLTNNQLKVANKTFREGWSEADARIESIVDLVERHRVIAWIAITLFGDENLESIFTYTYKMKSFADACEYVRALAKDSAAIVKGQRQQRLEKATGSSSNSAPSSFAVPVPAPDQAAASPPASPPKPSKASKASTPASAPKATAPKASASKKRKVVPEADGDMAMLRKQLMQERQKTKALEQDLETLKHRNNYKATMLMLMRKRATIDSMAAALMAKNAEEVRKCGGRDDLMTCVVGIDGLEDDDEDEQEVEASSSC